MAVGVKYRNRKYNAREKGIQKKIPLPATSLQLAANVVEETDSHVRQDVIKKSFDEC